MKKYLRRSIIVVCVATTLVFGVRQKTADVEAIALTTLAAIVATVLVVGMGATVVADVSNQQQVGTTLYNLGVEYGSKFGDLFDSQSSCNGPNGATLCMERGAISSAAINMYSMLQEKYGSFDNNAIDLSAGAKVSSDLIQRRVTTSSTSNQAFEFNFLNGAFYYNLVRFATSGQLRMIPSAMDVSAGTINGTNIMVNGSRVDARHVSTVNSYLHAGVLGMQGVRYISDIVDGMFVYSIANATTRLMTIKHTLKDGRLINDIADTNFNEENKLVLNNGVKSNWQVLSNGFSLPVIAQVDGVRYPLGQDAMDRLYSQSQSGVMVMPQGGTWSTDTIDEHIGLTIPVGGGVSIPKDLTSTSGNSIVLDQEMVKDIVLDEAGQPVNPGEGSGGSDWTGLLGGLTAFLGGSFLSDLLSPMNSLKNIFDSGSWIAGFLDQFKVAISEVLDGIGLKDFLTGIPFVNDIINSIENGFKLLEGFDDWLVDLPFVGPIVDSIGNVVTSVLDLNLTFGDLKDWVLDMPFVGPILTGFSDVVAAIGSISIPSVQSLTGSLVDGFEGLLQGLFVPTVNPFIGILSTIQSKFPFIGQITDLFMSVFNDIDVDEDLPSFKINFQGVDYEIISFDLLIPYRFWIYNITSFFIAFRFIHKMYKRVPRMITG